MKKQLLLILFSTLYTVTQCETSNSLPEKGEPGGNACYSCLNRWKGISTVIGYIFWPIEVFENFYNKISRIIDDVNTRNETKRRNKEKENLIKKYYCKIGEFNNPITNIYKLDKSLSTIVGQKYAMKIIRESVISIIQKYSEFDFMKLKKQKELEEGKKNIKEKLQKQNLSKKKINTAVREFEDEFMYENKKYLQNGPGSTFIYLAGPAGTGKTETAISLVQSIAFNNKPAFIIDASTLLSGDGKLSSLFKPVKIRTEKRNKILVKSDLDTYIRTAIRGVIIFNEIDKILADNNLARDLNEMLRTLKDNNYYIGYDGQKVDVSGFIFIFTSNEKIRKSEKDETGSMTEVHFDPSLRTRFRIIPFISFVKEEYIELIRRHFAEVKKSFIEMYEKYNININYENNIENYCAEYIINDVNLRNRGARSIYDVLSDNLKSKLFITIEKLRDENKLTGKKIYISFDEVNNEFVVNTESFIKHVKEKGKQTKTKTKIKIKYIIIFILLALAITYYIMRRRWGKLI